MTDEYSIDQVDIELVYELLERIDQLKNQIEEINRDKNKAADYGLQLLHEYQFANQKVAHLEEMIFQKDCELESVRGIIERESHQVSFPSEKEDLSNLAATLKLQVDSSSIALVHAQEDNVVLKEEVLDLNQRIDVYEQEKAKLVKEFKKSQSNEARALTNISSLEKENVDLLSQISHLKESLIDMDSLKLQNESLKDNQIDNVIIIEDMKRRCWDLESQLTQTVENQHMNGYLDDSGVQELEQVEFSSNTNMEWSACDSLTSVLQENEKISAALKKAEEEISALRKHHIGCRNSSNDLKSKSLKCTIQNHEDRLLAIHDKLRKMLPTLTEDISIEKMLGNLQDLISDAKMRRETVKSTTNEGSDHVDEHLKIIRQKNEHIATLKSLLDAHKATAERVVRQNVKTFNEQRTLLNSTVSSLREDLKAYQKERDIVLPMNALLTERCAAYKARISTYKSALEKAEKSKETIRGVLVAAVGQKIKLAKRLNRLGFAVE